LISDKARIDSEWQGFHVIRDPRDLIISAYFSHRYTHSVRPGARMKEKRALLNSLDEESGIAFMMFDRAPNVLAMKKWDYSDDRILEVKQEDITHDPLSWFEIIRDFSSPMITDAGDLGAILSANSFRKLSGGRPPGEIDDHNHYRSGLPGEWIKHFTPMHKKLWPKLFGNVVSKLKYEEDESWAKS